MTTLVVGGGGLLGSHVVDALRRHGRAGRVPQVPDWLDSETALDRLLKSARAADDPGFNVAWCAGAGTVATDPESLQREVRLFGRFLDGLATPPQVIFLASSAGGVYAGSPASPPFSERSETGALAPYGVAKLAMERRLAAYAARTGSRAVLGRISNLYGPGQNLDKAQGLVSRMRHGQLVHEPLGIYVSMDTLRDYLFVRDAAEMVVACLDRAAADPPGTATVKILASGQALSIAALAGESARVFRRSPGLASRPNRHTAAQVRDLRLRSVVWPEIDALARTPVGTGLHATGNAVADAVVTGKRWVD